MDFIIYIIVIAAFVGGLMWYRRRKQLRSAYVMPIKRASKASSWKLPSFRTAIKSHKEPKMTRQDSKNIVIISVKSRAGFQFASYELLQALSNAGLHYGHMEIFHRHEEFNGEGNVLFSVATINNPGTFDISNFGNFSCPGLCLFADLETVNDPLYTFDLLLETAYQLVDDLDGELFEGQTKPWSYESAQRLRYQVQAQYAERYETA